MDKETILVVEDEEIMRESLIAWFSSEGHTVDGASDGDQALSDYELESYDAMIIDLKLPEHPWVAAKRLGKSRAAG